MQFLFFLELFLLFVLSRKTTQNISFILYKLTRSKNAAIWGMAILFLPGTVIHEFSHAIAAILTGVRVGKMELFPEMHEGNLKLGSVAIEKTDFIRNFFVGIAPFIFGSILLLLIIYLVFSHTVGNSLLILLPLFYLIFAVSNTMFSSKKDMEGAIEFFIIIAFLFGFSYLLGFHPQNINWSFLPDTSHLFELGALFLCVPLGIDILIVFLALASTRRI